MKKIKISKKEWDGINKKAQAPAVKPPPVQAPPSPSRTTPSTPPSERPFNPFKPPRPAHWPKPKAKKKDESDKTIAMSALKSFEKILKCAQNYEREAHPAVKNFWTNIPQEHPFSKHPILGKYGPKLSEEGFDFSRGKLGDGNRVPPTNATQMIMEVQKILPEIFRLEADHKEELQELAKDITVEIWGIDRSMLEPEIVQEVGSMGMEQEEKGQLVPLTPKLEEEINKRITSNVLTQGASVHAMASVHHLVAEKIKQISPELLDLYTRMSGLATHQYYALNIPAIIQQMKNLAEAGAGWSKVEDNSLEAGQQGEESNVKVVAKAICFPVLCQELFKGVMELMSAYGTHHLSEDELTTVEYYADRLEDEPWYIMVGPALWRKVLSVIPKDLPLSHFVGKLHGKDPQEVHDILIAIIEEPNRAKEMLESFKEPEIKEQYVNEDEKPAGELVVPEETFEGLEDIFPTKDATIPPQPKKNKKDKGTGGLVVPKETFEGLEDVFQKRNKKIDKKS